MVKTDAKTRESLLKRLQEKGVRILRPESVDIGPEVSPDRISGDGVVIHGGCKIYGPKTLILSGSELGYESPVTINNCQLGREVRLNGGFFSESTFLDKASMGSGSQIREACLLEEEARGAHTVGLKHTILLPYVTLGSLINFCDCMMGGGTDSKNHSEVGSSYIHFNFTPNQDKATPSLIGDIPRGVMLHESPIFLGGQGGLVGPVRIEYGTIVTAGTIVRKDALKPNRMIFSRATITKDMPFHKGLYTNTKRIIKLNTTYIANLIALRRWYLDVRKFFFEKEGMGQALLQSAVEKLDLAIEERVKRLGDVAAGMPLSIEIYKKISGERVSEKTIRNKQDFFGQWKAMEKIFRKGLDEPGDPFKRDEFLKIIEKNLSQESKDYLSTIKGLTQEKRDLGTSWLQGLVDDICQQVWSLVPGFGI
jgi:UDP-N-acetylglucosamine/UDP-N-acetylgalactosamine diphosphorylase